MHLQYHCSLLTINGQMPINLPILFNTYNALIDAIYSCYTSQLILYKAKSLCFYSSKIESTKFHVLNDPLNPHGLSTFNIRKHSK